MSPVISKKSNTTSSMPALMTVSQAAELFNVSTSALYIWIDEGRIPYVDLGEQGVRRCIRFREDILVNYIERREKNQEIAKNG